MGKLASSHNGALLSWKAAKVAGFADINTLKRVDWSDSIEFLRCRLDKMPLKYRDPRMVEALAELQAQAPSVQAFVELLITLYRMGLVGVECSQDLLCAHVKRICHASRFGVRTLRSAASWATVNGYCNASWLPIGKRIATEGGAWRTAQIRRYASTYKIRLLVSILRLEPEKYIEKTDMSHKNAALLTPEKRSDNPSGELPKAGELYDPALGKLLRLDVYNDDRQETRGERLPGSAEPSSDGTKRAALESQASQADRSVASAVLPAERRANRPKVKADRFSDRRRGEARTTYNKARATFLKELFPVLKPGSDFGDPQAAIMYRIAAVQTEIFYPAALPAAWNWFDFLIENYFKNWADRRRDLERSIVPALRLFAGAWALPEIAEKDPRGAKRIADWEKSLAPDPGIAVAPLEYHLFFQRWSFARSYLSGLWAGRFDWDDKAAIGGSPIALFCDLYCKKH